MGPVRRVATLSRRLAVRSDLDDVTSVILDFASGATGSLTTLMATGGFWRLHVFGAEGWAQMPDQNRLVLADISGKQTSTTFDPIDTTAAELYAFAESIRSQAPYPVSFDEALAGVATMEAIGRSAQDGGAWISVANPMRYGLLDGSGSA